MGTLGASTQTEPSPKFKTSKYEKLYYDTMWNTGGFRTPNQRMEVAQDMLREEQAWLDNLGSEYEEIIAAQSAMDQTDGS